MGHKQCKYAKPGRRYKIYPNLLIVDLAINQPYQVVVSDMTAFWVNKIIMNQLYIWTYLIMKLSLMVFL